MKIQLPPEPIDEHASNYIPPVLQAIEMINAIEDPILRYRIKCRLHQELPTEQDAVDEIYESLDAQGVPKHVVESLITHELA